MSIFSFPNRVCPSAGHSIGQCAARFLATAALLVCGCAPLGQSSRGGRPSNLVSSPLETNSAPSDPSLEQPEPLIDPALDSTLLGYVAEGTFGPYQATRGEERIALWASLGEGDGRRWFSTPIPALDAPPTTPLSLIDAPSNIELVSLQGVDSGFLGLFTEPSSTGTRLTALALSPDGTLPAGSAPLVHSRVDILWLEALSVGSHPTALWATRAERAADLHLASLTVTGTTRTAPVRLLQGLKAWQVIPWDRGLAVASIHGRANSSKRRLEISFFDAEGSLLTRQKLAQHPSIGTDLDTALIAGQLVVAWSQSERKGRDSTVYGAALGQNGRILAKAHPIVAEFGPQRLVQLVAPRGKRENGYLVWENIGQAPIGERRLLVSRISEMAVLGSAQGRVELATPEPFTAEFAASERGLAVLTHAKPCPRDADRCAERSSVPTFVEFDRHLNAVASEPLRLSAEQGATVAMAWSLHCSADRCSSLGALATTPVPIYEIELRAHSERYRPAGGYVPSSEGPRIESMRAVARRKPVASLSSATLGKSTLVASLTEFDPDLPYRLRKSPAPDGRMGPVRAQLRVRRYNRDKRRAASDQILSVRARSVAGVQLISAPRNRALVIWSALDNQQPEVFVTLVDKNGKRVHQRMLTRAPGEVRALAAASIDKGFVATWIDEREDSPQVYGARLTANLRRGAPQRQVSSGDQPVLDLSLLADHKNLWLALLEGSDDGPQTLSLLALNPKTAAPLGAPRLIARSSEGGLSKPLLIANATSPLLLWLDTTTGRLLSAPVSVPSGSPARLTQLARWDEPLAGLTAECTDGSCRAIVDLRSASGARLVSLIWQGEGPATLGDSLSRSAPKRSHPAVTLAKGEVYYADRTELKGSIRHLSVQWQRSASTHVHKPKGQ